MFAFFKKYFSSTPKPNEELNIFKIFKPLYLILSLVGLFPYSVKFNKTKQHFTAIQKSIYVNSLCAVSTLLVIHLFLAAHIRQLFDATEFNSMTDAIMTQMNYVLELATLALVCCTSYVCAYIYRYKYVKILNDITSVYVDLTYGNVAKLGALRYHINVVVLGTITLVVVLQLLVNLTRADSIWKIILVALSFNFPQTIQVISLSLYYVLIMMLASILTSIEEYIRLFVKEKRKEGNFGENFIQVHGKISAVPLRQLELFYVKVLEITHDINKAFEAPILMTTLQCFHSIVSESYIIYHGAVTNTHSLHAIINCSIWIGYQFLKIYSLTRSGNLLRVEALKIGQVLHKVPIEQQDIRMLLEVQHFSSLVYGQGTVLTVYGYFPLDATLMSKMIGTVMMYLIILVQFDKGN